ncbi:MAG: glycosyltransferase family 4 protein [Terriglobia bacterium]
MGRFNVHPTNRGAGLIALTNIPAPYRIPTFNWLARRSGGRFRVAFIAPGDPRRNWAPKFEAMHFESTFLSRSLEVTSRCASVVAAAKALALLVRSDPESVICGGYDSFAAWTSFFWCKARRRRFVLWLESNARDQRTPGRLKNWLKRAIVSRANAIAASGKATADYVRQLGAREERIFVAPFGGDNDFFAREAAQVDAAWEKMKRGWPARLVLYSGRLVVQKGVYVLLEAFRSISQKLLDVGLLVVGNGPELESMQTFCDRQGLKQVYFAGPQPYERMPFYYALADVLVLPTFSDAWGFVVNEAFACGVPAIVSRVAGAWDDLIVEGETGFALEPGNAEELASKILRLIEDPELRAQMSVNCRRMIAPYSARACADGLLAAVKGER